MYFQNADQNEDQETPPWRPDLSVKEDEEEQAAMSNMSIDIDYLE